SMLKLLRDDRPTRQATMAVAVLADPVFDRADPRTRNSPPRRTQRTRRTGLSDVQDRSSVSPVSSVSSVVERSDIDRAVTESGLMRFERLSFSPQAAHTIEAPPPRGQVPTA